MIYLNIQALLDQCCISGVCRIQPCIPYFRTCIPYFRNRKKYCNKINAHKGNFPNGYGNFPNGYGDIPNGDDQSKGENWTESGSANENNINEGATESQLNRTLRDIWKVLDLKTLEGCIQRQKGINSNLLKEMQTWHYLGWKTFSTAQDWTDNFHAKLNQLHAKFRYQSEIEEENPYYQYQAPFKPYKNIEKSREFSEFYNNYNKGYYKKFKKLNWKRWENYLENWAFKRKREPKRVPIDHLEYPTPLAPDIFKNASDDQKDKIRLVKSSILSLLVVTEYGLKGDLIDVTSSRTKVFLDVLMKNMLIIQNNAKLVGRAEYTKNIFLEIEKIENIDFDEVDEDNEIDKEDSGKKNKNIKLVVAVLKLDILKVLKKRNLNYLRSEMPLVDSFVVKELNDFRKFIDRFASKIYKFYHKFRSEKQIYLKDCHYRYKNQFSKDFFVDHFKAYKKLNWDSWEDSLKTGNPELKKERIIYPDESLTFKKFSFFENLSTFELENRFVEDLATVKVLSSEEYALRVQLNNVAPYRIDVFLESLSENLPLLQENLDTIVNKTKDNKD